jgi:2,3-dihydroxybenzoate-AMP ligase
MLEGCTPLPEEFLRRYREAGALLDETLGEIVDGSAERFPERVALVAGERRLTYRELFELTEHHADQLVALGLRPQDRVVLQLPNIPEFVILYFALVKIGALPITALPAHRGKEINHFISHSEARAYAIPRQFRNFDYLALASQQKQSQSHLRLVLVADAKDDDLPPGFVSITRLLEKPAARRPKFRPDPFDIGLFQLSGGTTGLSKLIPRTHSDYARSAYLTGRCWASSETTVMLIALPIAHNFSLLSSQGTLIAGGTLVLSYDTEPIGLLSAIERERVTVLPGVPTLLINLMDHQEKQRRDLSALLLVVAGGAKFLASGVKRAYDVFQCKVQNVLGMAEGFWCWTSLDDPVEKVLETVGRPATPFDEIRVVDSDDREVRPGQIGELLTRGPYTVRAYYKAPEANAKSFTPDGFYRSGDLVTVDDDGYFTVMGRNKDFINRGGEKISAEEVENLVADHPKIKSAVLVAMPHPVTGEKGCLFVIADEGQTVTLGEVVEHLGKKEVAKFKYPERLEIVASFPTTAVGKVSRRDLRELIARKVAQERG